mmetsp:Transcript_159630/g.387567  ORF Transcript_159630/g.387567 Transcript_159630/m.387567 type:complete len:255 (-) Transcript_159630:3-767(-)
MNSPSSPSSRMELPSFPGRSLQMPWASSESSWQRRWCAGLVTQGRPGRKGWRTRTTRKWRPPRSSSSSSSAVTPCHSPCGSPHCSSKSLSSLSRRPPDWRGAPSPRSAAPRRAGRRGARSAGSSGETSRSWRRGSRACTALTRGLPSSFRTAGALSRCKMLGWRRPRCPPSASRASPAAWSAWKQSSQGRWGSPAPARTRSARLTRSRRRRRAEGPWWSSEWACLGEGQAVGAWRPRLISGLQVFGLEVQFATS